MKRTVLLSVLIKKNMPACARTSAWTHMVPHYIGRNTTILVLKVQFCLCLGELVNLQRESRWVEKGLWVCLFVLYAVWESSGCDYVPLDCFPVSSSNWSAWMFVVLNVLFSQRKAGSVHWRILILSSSFLLLPSGLPGDHEQREIKLLICMSQYRHRDLSCSIAPIIQIILNRDKED